MKTEIKTSFNCDLECGIAPETEQYIHYVFIVCDGEDGNSCEVDICSFGQTQDEATARLKEHILNVMLELQKSLDSLE